MIYFHLAIQAIFFCIRPIVLHLSGKVTRPVGKVTVSLERICLPPFLHSEPNVAYIQPYSFISSLCGYVLVNIVGFKYVGARNDTKTWQPYLPPAYGLKRSVTPQWFQICPGRPCNLHRLMLELQQNIPSKDNRAISKSVLIFPDNT